MAAKNKENAMQDGRRNKDGSISEYRKLAAERLRQIRSVVASSQIEVARTLRITPARWYRYESGERELSIEVLARFCAAYNVCPRWIILGDLECMQDEIAEQLLLAYPEIRKDLSRRARRLTEDEQPIAPRYATWRTGTSGTGREPAV